MDSVPQLFEVYLVKLWQLELRDKRYRRSLFHVEEILIGADYMQELMTNSSQGVKCCLVLTGKVMWTFECLLLS